MEFPDRQEAERRLLKMLGDIDVYDSAYQAGAVQEILRKYPDLKEEYTSLLCAVSGQE